MYEMKIKLDTIDKVKQFVGTITQFEGDFDIYSGKYIIDAKSILGIFSVDLSRPVILKIGNEEKLDEIRQALQAYAAE
ncbi:MAG: HPr family phosphocarrier protein [Lachnospiraceae bacterium]|jgi:phosphocarrier protein HPr|nr:HPr family phosphocarrier protein [Lachnospiraceae bacterium]NBJ81964.1 HPr family phosphocarrier protein [bacterium 1XD42-76]NBK04531.1 HPr family phosphocarrier protein [bacterium 1XD42-94]